MDYLQIIYLSYQYIYFCDLADLGEGIEWTQFLRKAYNSRVNLSLMTFLILLSKYE